MQELDAKDFQEKMKEGTVIDVRESEELSSGTLPGSLHYPLSGGMTDLPKGPLFFYCSRGNRSKTAALQSERNDTYSLRGGITSWKKLRLPIESPLSLDELDHYSRQILLPEIGAEGQKRIREARVLLVGAGGLGSPAALYLAGAGVGLLGLVDDDQVEQSNLPRQIIYRAEDQGKEKAVQGKNALQALNPDVEIEPFPYRLTRDNVMDILPHWDIVLDGADNFPTRYLLNDACKRLGVPLVSASILGFSGQLATFMPDGPCYRCLFPEPPPAELAPSCSEAGIIGTVAGTLGLLQANEALKIIAPFGSPLSDKLLLFDASETSFSSLNRRQNPECPVCLGEDRELPDYELFCANPRVS